jgi:hypothetical protein
MRITLIKEQYGKEYIKEMEDTYKSIQELEKILKTTNNMLMRVDLENWKYYLKHPDEKLTRGKAIFVEGLYLSDLEMKLLNHIKHDSPKSISSLSRLVNRDMSTIQPKIKRMKEAGLIHFKTGLKNSKIPVLNYDKIEIEI